jgi:peptide/nickel transport system substrate-binding protein
MALVAALAVTLFAPRAPAQPVAGGDFTFGYSSSFVDILDPHVTSQSVSHFIMLNVFDPLVSLRADGQIFPGLADSWTSSPDGLVWTFKLKQGVKFHDGTPLNAEAVKFSFDRMVDPETKSRQAGVALRGFYDRSEVVDANTVRIFLKKPKASFLTVISQAFFAPVSPKAVREMGAEFGRHPVGTGPFKFVEQVVGSHIKLAAVDNHWRTGTSKYKTVNFRLVPEETTRIALLRRAEVDVADVSRERVKELEKEGFPIHLRKEEAIIHMWWVLGPDGRVGPTKDKRVREALNVAIDRNEIGQSIFGGFAEPAAIPMGLSWAFKEVGFKPTPDMTYTYDPARAKKLLTDAGHGNGFPLDVYAFQLPGFPEGKAFAEAVAGYWEKIGVKPKLIPVDYPAFRKLWVDRKAPEAVGYYNVANRDWIGTFALLEKQAYTPSKLNDTVNDPEVDGMIAQVMRQTDREKINTLMRNIFTRLRSEHSGVPVVYVHSPYATSKTLGKWNPGSVMYDLFIDNLAAGK